MDPFEQITQPIIQALQGLAIPSAIIGISAAIIGFLLLPVFPGLQQQRGYILGFVPGLVTFFASLGGAGGG
jgi:hypothetical protein